MTEADVFLEWYVTRVGVGIPEWLQVQDQIQLRRCCGLRPAALRRLDPILDIYQPRPRLVIAEQHTFNHDIQRSHGWHHPFHLRPLHRLQMQAFESWRSAAIGIYVSVYETDSFPAARPR